MVPKSTTDEASAIFSFRTRMARFEENYKNGRNNVLCPLCHLHYDTQSMAFQCQKIGSEVRVIGNYEDYEDNIPLINGREGVGPLPLSKEGRK